MAQEVFTKAVKGYLPEAIPALLGKVDEYSVGKILIYSKKPRRKFFTRKYELDFTGWSLQSLLAEGENLTTKTATNFLFTTGKEKECKSFNASLGGELGVYDALLKVASGSADVKSGAGERATLELATDFGKISHVSSDLVNSIMATKLRVQSDHPIVKTAVTNGGVIYVISNIYQSERCYVSATVSRDAKEGTSMEAGVQGSKADIKEDTGSHNDSAIAVSREQPTALAYMLMKVKVNAEGVLKVVPNRRFSKMLEVHYPYPALMFDATTEEEDEVDGFLILGNEDEGDSRPLLSDKPATRAILGGEEDEGGEKPNSGVGDEQPSLDAVADPSPVLHEAKEEVGSPIPKVARDEMDGMPDEHFLFSLKDFQPFESHTYRGIVGETRQWVTPFVSNAKLQKAFLAYTRLPGSYERLNDLSAYFLDVGNAMRASRTPPPNKLKDVEPILTALSEDKETRLNEISSVVIVAEAADEFPQHILKKILELPSDKKEILIDLILQTPYGTSSHTYIDSSPFKDPALKPIMTRMGFSILGGNSLTHTHKEAEGDEDKLASALILLLASEEKN